VRGLQVQQRGASLSQIEAVYRERFGEFVGVTAAIVGDRAHAPDVVQDAFADVIRKRASYGRRGPLEAWIWRVVVNTALNRRAADQRGRVSRFVSRSSADGEQLDTAALIQLQEHLAALPERQRLIVFLRYYADLDYSTIGETLGISPGTVASTLNTAHATLRGALHEEVSP
jgi:RNA polymerase sigma factor (sigma-70 family)